MRSQLTLLITYAKCQRTVAYMVAGGALNIRKGIYKGRQKYDQTRWVNFQKADIEKRAQCMRDVIDCRLVDYEEDANRLLREAVERLTNARINRIAYAGRVLP